MIFYFSATGNSLHVARIIAQKTGDQLVDMAKCLRDETFDFSAAQGERIGFVVPTYCLGTPTTVNDFVDRCRLVMPDNEANKPYAYYVATYGTTPGRTGSMLEEHLAHTGIAFNAGFGVRMPDTWTPVFDLSDSHKVAQRNKQADVQADQVASRVVARMPGTPRGFKVPRLVCNLYYHKGYEAFRRTSHFHVEDSCIGCGRCAHQCPAQAIEMCEGRPVWTQDQCAMCLACLHRCPCFSIQYGSKTKAHGQYVHPGE